MLTCYGRAGGSPQVDGAVDIRVVTDDGHVVGSNTTVGTALIPNVLDYRDGCLHTVQLPLMNMRAAPATVVGVLHVRVRVTPINPNVVAVRPATHCPPRHRMPFNS